ncbi:MAG: glycosyltransferase family 4 protein [Demequinaceae bacterium]|nr:glycosyltransferase family 4 protein [Demequinaceae bacterium]
MARIFVNLLSYTGLKGGMERYSRELYRTLGAMETGHEWVGYASTECAAGDTSWFPGDIVESGISGENRIKWALGELFAVGRAARKANADLVHSPATLGPWRTRMPAVYTMHDMLYFSLPDLMAVPAYNKPVQWMEKRAASNAARILTDSEVSKGEIVKFLGYPAEKIHVVALGATPPTTSPDASVVRERDLFLATGQRLKHKNFEGLVRAIAHIPEHQRPRLVVTGSFHDDPLVPLVDELGVAEWVDLRGWIEQSELEWLTQHATALMVPGFHDGFSLPMLEAWHVGLPVLASDAAIFREVGGDAVGRFEPRDPSSIAAAMLRALAEPEWLEDFAARGFARVKRYTWERTAHETLAIFEEVLAER